MTTRDYSGVLTNGVLRNGVPIGDKLPPKKPVPNAHSNPNSVIDAVVGDKIPIKPRAGAVPVLKLKTPLGVDTERPSNYGEVISMEPRVILTAAEVAPEIITTAPVLTPRPNGGGELESVFGDIDTPLSADTTPITESAPPAAVTPSIVSPFTIAESIDGEELPIGTLVVDAIAPTDSSLETIPELIARKPLIDHPAGRKLLGGIVAAAAFVLGGAALLLQKGDKEAIVGSIPPAPLPIVDSIHTTLAQPKTPTVDIQNEITAAKAAGATIVDGAAGTKYAFKTDEITRFSPESGIEKISMERYLVDVKAALAKDATIGNNMLQQPITMLDAQQLELAINFAIQGKGNTQTVSPAAAAEQQLAPAASPDRK